MSINVNNQNPYASAYGTAGAQKTSAKKAETAAEENKAQETKANEDTFVKSGEEAPVTYKPDVNKINEMKASFNNKMDAFQTMVQSMFGKQIDFSSNVMQQLQDAISGAGGAEGTDEESFFNDPEWGVEAVAGRIVEFAKALSGGDPSKISMLRNAVEKGFEAAGVAWGGEMPEITGKTYSRVQELFDEWENGKSSSEQEATENVSAE